MPCFRPNSWRSIVPSIHVVEESFQSYRVGEDEHFAARGPGDVLVGEAPREVDEVTGAGHELVVAARDGVAAPEHVERLVHVRMAVQRGAVSGWGAASDQGEVFARVHALASRYPPAEGMWRAVSGELSAARTYERVRPLRGRPLHTRRHSNPKLAPEVAGRLPYAQYLLKCVY